MDFSSSLILISNQSCQKCVIVYLKVIFRYIQFLHKVLSMISINLKYLSYSTNIQ